MPAPCGFFCARSKRTCPSAQSPTRHHRKSSRGSRWSWALHQPQEIPHARRSRTDPRSTCPAAWQAHREAPLPAAVSTTCSAARTSPTTCVPRLSAARELVRRYTLEEMGRGPVLSNPSAVRDNLPTATPARSARSSGSFPRQPPPRDLHGGAFRGDDRRGVRAPARGREARTRPQCRRGDPRPQPSEGRRGAQPGR